MKESSCWSSYVHVHGVSSHELYEVWCYKWVIAVIPSCSVVFVKLGTFFCYVEQGGQQ